MKQIQLSYSSMRDLSSCEAKYYYRKVAQVEKDADAEESDALGVGKAFHEYLEDVLHGEKFDKATFESAICAKAELHNVRSDAPLIAAMALAYMQLHKASGLKVVKCEQTVETPKFIGYIDVILVDDAEGWWIGDLKTAARFDENKVAQLPKDEQLNLYSHFAQLLAPHFDLNPDKFRGCRYRVTTKTKSVIKVGESITDFAKRMVEKQSVISYDAIIPVEFMDVETTWNHFNHMHDRATAINNGEAPTKNLGNCMAFFRPCDYWSQCHGKCFTEMKSDPVVRVMTKELYDEDLL
jgi:hypothetical protein